MSAHRYWRVYATAMTSNSGTLQYEEVQFRTSIGGATVTTGGTASASSSNGGTVPANAFDGTSSTWLTVGALPQWIAYDFGAGNDKDIVEFGMKPAPFTSGAKNMPKSFELQYSDDGSSWTTLIKVGDSPLWVGGTLRVFSADAYPDHASESKFAWRVRTTATVSSGGLNVGEVKFLIGGVNQCSGGTIHAQNQSSETNLPTKAFDGAAPVATFDNYTGLGASGAGWIGYRMTSSKDVEQVEITGPYTSGSPPIAGAPTDFVIEYWNGTTWVTALTVTGASWTSAQVQTYNIASTAARRPVVFVCT